ncbi:glucose PTS transporter subunit IIA [Companilactobacillus allii]|uniref:glucose PTS transporter subunit IIA n=1 Tax=Companilactobacillus allii TaxID=1847728 RepID=UPI001CEF6465|nr:PTS glucose transporter subunit IIABC [Companilactobacillus allii]USQ68390.1 glucose PTS transporter subunit IIA [Companilactobacillus allii]
MEDSLNILAPISGKVIDLTTVNDPVFSKKMMGEGFGILPSDNYVTSPVSGTITLVAKTKHAIGITTPNGVEILIHMGIDTVTLNGTPFEIHVKVNDKVSAGQLIAIMDLTAIIKSGKDPTVIVAITNSDKLNDIKIHLGKVDSGQIVATTKFHSNSDKEVDVPTNYHQIAEAIIQNIGGVENVSSLIHCMTRLRFYLINDKLTNDSAIKNIDGIINIVRAGGQYQVVIGPSIDDIYAAVVDILGPKLSQNNSIKNDAPKSFWAEFKNYLNSFIHVLTGSMLPIIGLLGGSGILKGILGALCGYGILEKSSGTYLLFSAIGDSLYYFLPIILGFTTAKVLGANPITMAVVGGVLTYPSLITAGNEAIQLTVFRIPAHIMSYTSSVFPIIFAAWVGSYLEKWLKKVIPSVIRSVFLPIIEVILLSLLIYVGVGPVMLYLSKLLSLGVESIYFVNPALTGVLVSGLYQILVIFGLHWAIIPILVNDLAINGHSYLNAMISVTMVAQGAAAMAVALKTRDKKYRDLSWAATLSAFCGVTEPAIYGITLKYKRIFILSNIGSAIGGFLAGFFKVDAYALSGSLIGFPAFINPNVGVTSNLQGYVIAHIATLIVTFILVFVWGDKDPVSN